MYQNYYYFIFDQVDKRIISNSASVKKPGEQKGEGKGVFCRREGGGLHKGGGNFLVSIFNVAINLFWGNSTLMMIMMRMILSFLAFVWQPREGTEGQCFALLYGSPRSHLTSTHCGSSSVEISDRGH